MKMYSVRLLVERFDACFRFYRDVIGLEPVWGEEGGDYADLKAQNGALVALFKREMMAEALGTQDLPSQATAQDRLVLVLQADDLEETVSRLRGEGVDMVTEPKDFPAWGIRAAHLRDPDGNLIELFAPMPVQEWSEETREADRRYKEGS